MISRITPKLEGLYINPKKSSSHGKYGHAIQKKYDEIGIETNYGEGNDIPEMDLEIKSWDPAKRGHISVGSHPIDEIISTNGECFLDKMQKWNLHKHDSGVVTRNISVDFRNINDSIKQELKELVKSLDINSKNKVTICSSENFVIERCGNNSGKLRIKHSQVDSLIHKANSTKSFNELFGDQ